MTGFSKRITAMSNSVAEARLDICRDSMLDLMTTVAAEGDGSVTFVNPDIQPRMVDRLIFGLFHDGFSLESDKCEDGSLVRLNVRWLHRIRYQSFVYQTRSIHFDPHRCHVC